jgi:peptidoglycan/xylan/chitin deacetylase (PgdA/CDA1 family)
MRRLGLELVRARWAMVKLRAAVETAGGRRAVGLDYGTRLPVLAWDAGVAASAGGLDRLARHLRALAGAGYRGIRPSDWLRWTDAGEPLPRRPVLLTFDGESRALGDRVLPLVREHGLDAAVFVATACLGRAGSLAPGQVEQWARAGIEFGSRGRRGDSPYAFEGAALVDEVEGSAADLAKLLGRRPIGFAYPPGRPTEAVCERVRRNFPLGFTRQQGFNRLCDDPHQLHRIPMDGESTFGLRWALRCGRTVRRPRKAEPLVQEAEVTP